MYQSEHQTDTMPATTEPFVFLAYGDMKTKINTAVFIFYVDQCFVLQIKYAICCQLPVFPLYKTTQGTESHIYSAFHQHQQEPS